MTTNVTRLKEVLQGTTITPLQLAQRCHVRPSAINYIVNGKSLPNLRTGQKIAHMLHTTTDYLCPYKEEDDKE
jgi:DNA-binding XRE family transcriptional regulator